MSNPWIARLLLSPPIAARHLDTAFDTLEAAGWTTRHGPDGIVVVSGFGDGTLIVGSRIAAAHHLASSDGLVMLGCGSDQISLSVHRANGVLRTELAPFKDTPVLDEIVLEMLPAAPKGRDVFERFLRAVALVASSVPLRFGYVCDEEALESILMGSMPHRDLGLGTIPMPVGWIVFVTEPTLPENAPSTDWFARPDLTGGGLFVFEHIALARQLADTS